METWQTSLRATAPDPMPSANTDSAGLRLRVRYLDDPAALAFAGVIRQSLHCDRRPLIRGLGEADFRSMLDEYFSADGASGVPDNDSGLTVTHGGVQEIYAFDGFEAFDEFDDLVALLLDHRATADDRERWLACAIATAAMGENHLWQDVGLPNRAVLSALMRAHFPTLAALNVNDMKWKKFFYRQLCERAGVLICKSPHCADCCDFRLCFGPEDVAL